MSDLQDEYADAYFEDEARAERWERAEERERAEEIERDRLTRDVPTRSRSVQTGPVPAPLVLEEARRTPVPSATKDYRGGGCR